MRVKMCGMKTIAAAYAARDAGADYIGFIFARESRRYITPKDAHSICAAVDVVKKVGVFVDADPEEMNEIAAYCGLDYVQLHGHEPAEAARRVERPVIKAYRCGDDFDADAANAYPAEIILVDSYAPGAAGGTGAAFAWEDAAREIARVTKPSRAAQVCAMFSISPDAVNTPSSQKILSAKIWASTKWPMRAFAITGIDTAS